MITLSRSKIESILPGLDLTCMIEGGFAAYSEGKAVVPPVGELLLDGGDVHIKYGYIKGDPYYVIKIASGFYGNPALGLPSSNGMMLLFSTETGRAECILLDEGLLTDIRTAVAGAIAAKFLAPKNVQKIGIVGTGIQARLQLEYLKAVTNQRNVLVWGRGDNQLKSYRADVEKLGFKAECTSDIHQIGQTCNLIVTTTPSTSPLIEAADIRPGAHITAMGSDTEDKVELDPVILKNADLIVADSISQCLERGEIHHALKAGFIHRDNLVEIGSIIKGDHPGRTSDDQITVADLTGVAVQDIKIATAVFEGAGCE